MAKPRLIYAMSLRCPFCGKTPLRAVRSWFVFGRGCQTCNYRFEREPGYYTGASWMINYTVTALTGLSTVALLKVVFFPEVNSLLIVAGVSLLMIVVAILITPFSKALWLWGDLYLNPPDENDRLDQ